LAPVAGAMGWPHLPVSALLDSNRSINTIYATNDLDEEQDFLSVIDAIQGDVHPRGTRSSSASTRDSRPPVLSDDEVLAAAAAGEITLDSTDEVYRCSIFGSK